MPHFKIDYTIVELELAHPFTISRGTKKTVQNVFLKLQSGGISGFGEAAPNRRYDEDAEKVIQYLKAIPKDFFDPIETPTQLASKLNEHNNSVRVIKSGQAAVEMAWLDYWGKSRQQPLWKLLGAKSSKGPQTSYTIGLDEIDIMQQKVRDAAEFPIYKVKLGTGRDRQIIKGIRAVTDKPLYVDANEGWQTLEEAAAMLHFLKDHNIAFVEQPMPSSNFDEMQKLKKNSPISLCADESFLGEESLERIAEAFDIINIKLMKTGSIIESLQIITKAKSLGLEIMIGCMIESSLANTAGALLALWADYADLDGHLLIKNDLSKGLELDTTKHVYLQDTPGLGVKVLNFIS